MAAITRTVMHSPFPTSGNTLTGDGNPLHSRLGIDLMYGVNNLAYRYQWAAFVHSTDPTGFECSMLQTAGTTDVERFMAQAPTVLPPDGVRFGWTLGFTAINDSAVDDMVIEKITLYLSPTPYKPTAAETSFDSTQMGVPVYKMEITTSLTVTPASNSGYQFIDQSTGFDGAWLPFRSGSPGGLVRANLILTATGHLNDTDVLMKVTIHDFNPWVLPE